MLLDDSCEAVCCSAAGEGPVVDFCGASCSCAGAGLLLEAPVSSACGVCSACCCTWGKASAVALILLDDAASGACCCCSGCSGC